MITLLHCLHPSNRATQLDKTNRDQYRAVRPSAALSTLAQATPRLHILATLAARAFSSLAHHGN